MFPTILLGKFIQKMSRIRGNGGSALPGLIVEKINPNFVKKVLKNLKYGVVVISGTNGKTTTTKIVTEILEKQGLKVFTNNTGSNFIRGVISAIIQTIKFTGKFDYDIAILELDEAHAVKFAEVVPIHYSLLLNVQRDQLDRFGEIDHTAKLLEIVASHTQKAIVVNREDSRLNKIKSPNIIYYGLSNQLAHTFPSDDNLLTPKTKSSSNLPAKIILDHIKGSQTFYKIGVKIYPVKLELSGIYNAFNAAGAMTLVQAILPEIKPDVLASSLENITSAFGRGETFQIGDTTIELFLVKNPSAFQLSLESFADSRHEYLIAINDAFADGRDVSWLWNVDFEKLKQVVITSGTRAHDMALRLKYDDIPTENIEKNLSKALREFINHSNKPKRIFATYTAMLAIRKQLTGKSLL